MTADLVVEPAAVDADRTGAGTWVPACRSADVPPERAVAALLGADQVALVRLHDGTLHGVDHRDPFSGAAVMARGIVGTATVEGREVPTLASPMYKQVFDLRSGDCLTDPSRRLGTWQVRERDGVVEVLARAPESAPHPAREG